MCVLAEWNVAIFESLSLCKFDEEFKDGFSRVKSKNGGADRRGSLFVGEEIARDFEFIYLYLSSFDTRTLQYCSFRCRLLLRIYVYMRATAATYHYKSKVVTSIVGRSDKKARYIVACRSRLTISSAKNHLFPLNLPLADQSSSDRTKNVRVEWQFAR